MKIKVTRDYSGEEGIGPDKHVLAGTEHIVSRTRGNELKRSKLVEILEDSDEDAHGAPVEVESEDGAADQGGEKKAAAPADKAAAKPANKANG